MVMNLEKTELNSAISFFAKVFKIDKEVASSDDIVSLILNIPTELVEYPQKLQGEDSKLSLRRQESFDIYDGKIDHLVECLREANPELRKLQKWELIFTIYKTISNPDKIIKDAYNKYIASTKPAEPPVMEKPSSVAKDANDTKSNEVKSNIPKPTMAGTANKENNEVKTQPITEKHQTKETEITNNMPNFKEESNMATTEEIMKKAADVNKGAQAGVDPKPKKSNVTTAEDEEIKALVAEQIGGTLQDRRAWTSQNFITAGYVPMKPAALRTKDDKGVLTKETDANEAKKAVTEKFMKFLSNISGKSINNEAEWNALDDKTKYRALIVPSNQSAVEQVIKIFRDAINGDPTNLKVKAYIPDYANLSFSFKAYDLGGKVYSTNEIIKEGIESSIGWIYGIGSLNPDMTPVAEKAVSFKIMTAARNTANTSKGVGSGNRKADKFVLRPTNKKEFIKDPAHVKYFFEQIDENYTSATANFKAEVRDSKGNAIPASFACAVYDGDKRKVKKTNDKGEEVYEKVQAICNLSVPVDKPIKVFTPDIKGDAPSDLTVANRFEMSWSTKTETKDPLKATDITQLPVFGNLVKAMSTGISFDVATLNSLKAARKKVEAEEAASVEEEL